MMEYDRKYLLKYSLFGFTMFLLLLLLKSGFGQSDDAVDLESVNSSGGTGNEYVLYLEATSCIC